MAPILDTGPLLAALDAADPDHAAAASLLVHVTEDLIVPTLVLAELDYWCARRLSPVAYLTFPDDVLAGAYRIEAATPAPPGAGARPPVDLRRPPLDVVDASIIALAERLQEPKVATLDHRHFAAVRPSHVESLRLVP